MPIYLTRHEGGYATPDKPRIGLLELDVFTSEEHTMENVFPQHPVESGYSISDAVLRRSDTLTVEGIISTAPMSTDVQDTTPQRADNAYTQLRDMMNKGAVVTVVTSLRVYRNMGISRCTPIVSSTTGQALKFTATFTEIRTAATSLLSVEKIPDQYSDLDYITDAEAYQVNVVNHTYVSDHTVVAGVPGASTGTELDISGTNGIEVLRKRQELTEDNYEFTYDGVAEVSDGGFMEGYLNDPNNKIVNSEVPLPENRFPGSTLNQLPELPSETRKINASRIGGTF